MSSISRIIDRGSDRLAVLDIADNSKTSSGEISKIAAEQLQQFNFPSYKADGANTALIFHTESGDYLLGLLRANPALKEKLTPKGEAYPLQFNSSIGGWLPNPELSFGEAKSNAFQFKMFLKDDLTGAALEAQNVVRKVLAVMQNADGWEDKVCVHTDKWPEKDTAGNTVEKTMCALTGIKHIQCRDADLEKITSALKVIWEAKKAQGGVSFERLQPVLDSAKITYLMNEKAKADRALTMPEDKVAVIFNDLSMATLALNGAFTSTKRAQLNLG